MNLAARSMKGPEATSDHIAKTRALSVSKAQLHRNPGSEQTPQADSLIASGLTARNSASGSVACSVRMTRSKASGAESSRGERTGNDSYAP
jgi:hypothetical protein